MPGWNFRPARTIDWNLINRARTSGAGAQGRRARKLHVEELERRALLAPLVSINDVTEYATSSATTRFAFTVSLNEAGTLPVSVDYATADGTATVADGDYQAQAGTLTFNPGVTTETVTILVTADSPHGNETFFVNLANPVNGTLAAGGQQGVGTILGVSSGKSYYVNGPSTAGDVYCTAPGNNSNDGKTPATPVASLSGLLSIYTFHPGDTIYIDTGAYDLYKNVTLGPEFSGVRIVGAGPREVTPSVDGSAVLADGPIAFWRLGDAGGTTAVDATGDGYNGTYVGDVTPEPNAPTNDGAGDFHGDGSYVTVPDTADLEPSQLTIEAWVNFQGNPQTDGESVIMIDGYSLSYDNGAIVFATPSSAYPVSAPIQVGVWTFVMATLDSKDNEMLYLNGVLADGPEPGLPLETNGQQVEIGSTSNANALTWKGGLCDVALYNKVLTPTQIQAQYDQEVFTGTVLNRGNTSAGSYGIELDGATDVGLSELSVTGGAVGIYADAGSGSLRLTVQDVGVYGNLTGIDLESSNDDASITGSSIYGAIAGGTAPAGIDIAADDALISGDTIYGNDNTGVEIEGSSYSTISDSIIYDNGLNGISGGGSYEVTSDPEGQPIISFLGGNYDLISGNEIYANGNGGESYGIDLTAPEATVIGNQVQDNEGDGIYVTGVTVTVAIPEALLEVGNTVYGNTGTGIDVGDYGEARDNIVYDNKDGIDQLPSDDGGGEFDATADRIDANRVFGNSNIGVTALVATIVADNDVYSNAVGIEGTGTSYDVGPGIGPFDGTILNNVVYANSQTGILLLGAIGAQITNNTVYQPVGDGVSVSSDSFGDAAQGVVLLNNIIWTQAGYDINVAAASQQGFSSNYNLLYTTELGYIGYWQTSFANLRDWQVETGLDPQSIDADPRFINPAGPDGILGVDPMTGVDGGLDDDFHLQNGSSAVAAGDPASDDSAQPGPTGGRINLGAYGNTPQATTAAGAGVIVDPPGESTQVVNGGAEGSISIVLSGQPTNDVTVTLTSESQLTLSSTALTFTSANWDVAQSLVVKAVFDPAETGDVTASITPAVSSADADYNGIAVPSITVQVVPQWSMSTPTPTPTPTITWAAPAGITYGTALSSTQLDATASVPGTFSYTPKLGTILGAGPGQTLSVTFTPTDTTDYTTASTSVPINVAQATLTITADDQSKTYGSAFAFAGDEFTTSGLVNGDTVSNVTLTSAGAVATAGVLGSPYPITPSAGVGTGLSNYSIAYLAGTLTVIPAPLTITASDATIVAGQPNPSFSIQYSGFVLGQGPGVLGGTLTFSTPVTAASQAGTYPIVPGGLTSSNYVIAYVDGTLTVTPNPTRTPAITWVPPAEIAYGTALSSTQLDATVGVPGTFSYAPKLGTILGAGPGQTLSVTFTPTDTTDYTTASISVSINVVQAAPAITWVNPASIVYGTALSATQLDATASWTVGGQIERVAGTFTYTPAVGTVLGPGNRQTLSVTFTPTDTSDYTGATGTTAITVAPAPISTPLVTVTSVEWETLPVRVDTGKKGKMKSETVLEIQFSGPVAGARNLSVYQLSTVKTKKIKKKVITTLKPIRLSSALPASSPLTISVALVPASKPNLALADQIQITAAGLTDAQGRALAVNDGQAGGDFVATLNRSGVISMARTRVEAHAGRVTARAIDAMMADGSLAGILRRKHGHELGAR
jgi:hypothetical protein